MSKSIKTYVIKRIENETSGSPAAEHFVPVGLIIVESVDPTAELGHSEVKREVMAHAY